MILHVVMLIRPHYIGRLDLKIPIGKTSFRGERLPEFAEKHNIVFPTHFITINIQEEPPNMPQME